MLKKKFIFSSSAPAHRKWHGMNRLLEKLHIRRNGKRGKQGIQAPFQQAVPLNEGIANEPRAALKRQAMYFLEPYKYLVLWRNFIRDYKKLREDLSRKSVNSATYLFLLNTAVGSVAGKLSGAFLGGYLAFNGSSLAASSGPFIANLVIGTIVGNMMWFLTTYNLFYRLASESASKTSRIIGAAWELEKEVARMVSRPLVISFATYGAAAAASYGLGSFAGAAAAGSLSAAALFVSLVISLPIVTMVNKHAIERLAKRLGIPKNA